MKQKENKLGLEKFLGIVKDKTQERLIEDLFEIDVKLYIQRIISLEKRIQNKEISIEKACKLFMGYSDRLSEELRRIGAVISNRSILRKVKQLFREKVKNYITKSFIIKWAFDKPFGYPGDFKIIEMFYDNIVLSEGVGFCGDQYILQNDYVNAVRIRKDIMQRKLSDFITKSPRPYLNILNIGCGSCREIRELLSKKSFNKKIKFILLDWDEKALFFAREQLKKYQSTNKIKFQFKKENVVGFYKHPEKDIGILGNQDLIYSIGLADYIPDIILGGIIKFCFRLLKEGGHLVVAHKNVTVHKAIISDWFCNWYFYPRSEERLKSIIGENLKNYSYNLRIEREKTGHIFFVILTKK